MKKGAIIRFITVCIACFSIIFYNIFGAFDFFEGMEYKELKKDTVIIQNLPEKEEKEEKNTTSKVEEKKETATNNQTVSVEVSAKAIKGKIQTKYISPYNAPLSYNKVYLKNNTELKIDIKELLASKLSFKIEKNSGPQVLILHTHATETFMTEDTDYFTDKYTSRTRDNSKNMIKIGEKVAQKLNDAGIKTLHDKTQHDYPNYTGSYSRAAETICSYLKKYPSIKVVLDLHRDAVTADNGDKVKLVTKINGKKAAQVMLVMGSQSGSVTNFPKWKENMKLAVSLQQKIEEKYPTLARPLTLNSKNYNESLTTGSLLLEFGTDANTLEEALYSAEMVGNSLAELLNNI